MTRSSDEFRWLPACTILILAWLTLFPVVSVDAHYHLAAGRRILDEGSIPSRGVGSATFGHAPWHDNEWGFQLLVAALADVERDGDGVWVLTRSGLGTLIVLRALCLALTLVLLSAQMRRAAVEPLTRAVALVLAAFLTFGNLFWAIRPQILSYLGLALVAFLLEVDRGGRRRVAWLVPAVIAAWANIHGAFVIGIALVGTEALGDSLDAAFGRERWRRARRLWGVALACVAAACLNPHGYLQVLHPFLYLLRPEIHRGNVEWSRPDFLHLPLFVLTLVLLALALSARGRARAADWMRCLAFTVLLITAIRHLPLAAIVLVPVLASSLGECGRRGGWRGNLEPTGRHWAGRPQRVLAAALIAAAVVGLSGAFTRSGARFVTLLPRIEFRPASPMPERGVRLLARAGIDGSIFNGYRFGGFLMFRLYPQERVFMDGRNDLYGTFRDEVYNPILAARPGWRDAWRRAVDEHDVCCVMVDETDGLAGRLAAEGGWIAPAGGVLDGTPGRDGVISLVRDTPANREALRIAIGAEAP